MSGVGWWCLKGVEGSDRVSLDWGYDMKLVLVHTVAKGREHEERKKRYQIVTGGFTKLRQIVSFSYLAPRLKPFQYHPTDPQRRATYTMNAINNLNGNPCRCSCTSKVTCVLVHLTQR
jgi:hypothetical protein